MIPMGAVEAADLLLHRIDGPTILLIVGALVFLAIILFSIFDKDA